MMQSALRTLFRSHFGEAPSLIVRAPGRVNLIGEHTDYNDGFVLPCAISRQTMVAARVRSDRMLRIVAGDLNRAEAVIDLDAPILPDPGAPWSNYARGMAALLIREGVAVPGADIAILGDMPQGAGLSSSAALENAVGLALATLAGQGDLDRTRLAQLGQQAEHDFAGCPCGIMDQLVSARAEAGHALLIDCRSLDARAIALPPGMAVMIVHSGISRALVDGQYEARRRHCEEAARHYGVAALRDLDEAGLDAGKAGLSNVAYRRARHVVTENARTLAAADALAAGDLVRFGVLMKASHASMRDEFEITLPAIDDLVALLDSAIGGVGGARMTGGGFGGAVVALMMADRVEAVRAAVLAGYRTPDGGAPEIMIERACAGVSVVE